MIGTAISSVLPWLGIPAVTLVALSLATARPTARLAVAATMLWLCALIPAFPALPAGGGEPLIRIASQNVRAQFGDGGASAHDLATAGADVIALTELDGTTLAAVHTVLSERYPHSYAVGTVAIWSRYPIAEAHPLGLGLGWNRALRATLETPAGELAVYVTHAASLRPGQQDTRDTMLRALADEVAVDTATRIVAVGDFNAPSTDPALWPLRGQLEWVSPTDGSLGFTWPSRFPVARIDHVFARGITVESSTTRDAGASDHLATVTVLGTRS